MNAPEVVTRDLGRERPTRSEPGSTTAAAVEAQQQDDGDAGECRDAAQAGDRPSFARWAVAGGRLDQGMGEAEEAEREQERSRARSPGVPGLEATRDDQHLADKERRGR